MDFSFNEDQRSLQEAARRFCQENLPPLAVELDQKSEPVPGAWMKRYAELGYLGINAGTPFGGLGLPHLDALIVLEEFAKISIAVAFPVFECCTGPVRIIENFGSDALKARVIPRVIAGDMLVAISMSEPDAGSALTDLRTQSRVEGDYIVINGNKLWCSGAGHS